MFNKLNSLLSNDFKKSNYYIHDSKANIGDMNKKYILKNSLEEGKLKKYDLNLREKNEKSNFRNIKINNSLSEENIINKKFFSGKRKFENDDIDIQYEKKNKIENLDKIIKNINIIPKDDCNLRLINSDYESINIVNDEYSTLDKHNLNTKNIKGFSQ